MNRGDRCADEPKLGEATASAGAPLVDAGAVDLRAGARRVRGCRSRKQVEIASYAAAGECREEGL